MFDTVSPVQTLDCRKCGQDKPVEEFAIYSRISRGRQYWCKACTAAYTRARRSTPEVRRTHAEQSRAGYARNRDRIAERRRERNADRGVYLRERHGITVERYGELLADQDGRCANRACPAVHGEATPLHVDHDHRCCPGGRSCGQCVRGLLCGPCNRAAGCVRDDAARLRALADYLEVVR